MGRGRAKAKQTKVARELKYSSPVTDLEALQRELSGDGAPPGPRNPRDDDERVKGSSADDEYDEYRR